MHAFSKLHIDFQKSPHFVLYVQCVSVCELYVQKLVFPFLNQPLNIAGQ